MSVRSLAQRVGVKSAGVPVGTRMALTAAEKDPIAKAGEHLTSYLPSGMITWFIPLWAAIVAAGTVPRDIRFWIAVGFAVLTLLTVWGLGFGVDRRTRHGASPEEPEGRECVPGLDRYSVARGRL